MRTNGPICGQTGSTTGRACQRLVNSVGDRCWRHDPAYKPIWRNQPKPRVGLRPLLLEIRRELAGYVADIDRVLALCEQRGIQ